MFTEVFSYDQEIIEIIREFTEHHQSIEVIMVATGLDEESIRCIQEKFPQETSSKERRVRFAERFSYDQELYDYGFAIGYQQGLRLAGKVETINNGLQKGQKIDFMLELTGISLAEYDPYMKKNFVNYP